MTNRNVPSTTRNGNTSLGRDGSSVLQSNASVFSASHVQETRQSGGKTSFTLVVYGGRSNPCTWCRAGRRLDAGLWGCIDAALCNDINASMLTRLYGQGDFQGLPLELVEKVQNAILKEFALEPVANEQAIFRVAQHCPCRYLVWCDAGGQRPRCRHDPGLVGTRCTAGHGQKDRNHMSFPAGRQARQGRRLTNPRCVRATHGWRRALQISARKPRRCTQGVRQISGSSNSSGHRQDWLWT